MGDRFVRGTAFGVALLALLVAHLAGVGLGAASQTPSTASPVAEPRTVGELADRVTAAWASGPTVPSAPSPSSMRTRRPPP